MKFTRITVAAAAVSGILFTSLFGIYAAGAVFAASLFILLIYSFIKRSADMGALILTAVFAAASFSYALSISPLRHQSLDFINRYVTLHGVVLSTARETESGGFRYVMRVKSVSNKFGTRTCSENIMLSSSEKLDCGASIRVRGIISDLPSKMNENGFDYALYCKSDNIFTRIYSDDISDTDKIHVFSVYLIAQKAAAKIDSVIYKYYEGDGAALLSAILAGNKHNFSTEYNEILSATAFKRILHPAHIHVWIIVLLSKPFVFYVKKQYRDTASALIYLVYAALQCSNIGFARCLLCAAITVIYRMHRGNSHFPDTMATLVIICSLFCPTILFNASFILSVLGGMLSWAFIPYFRRKFAFLPKPLRRTAAATVVLALFLTPLSSYYYSGLCLYAFFTPFVTTPLIIAVLFMAPVTFMLMSVFSSEPIFGAYLNFFVKILYRIPFVINSLPFSSLNIAKPSIAFIIMYICAIIAVYGRIKNRGYSRILLTVSAGLCLSLAVTQAARLGTAEFSFVNVGQGDGAVIHTPYGETVIIDGGGGNSFSDYDPGKSLFVPYLEAKGINRIEVAVVSHFHRDHVQGVIDTIRSVKTDFVYAPMPDESYSDDMKEWVSELRSAAEECGTTLCFVDKGTRLRFRNGLTFDIYVSPYEIRTDSENDSSLPIKVSYGNFSVLYTGDMSYRAELAFTEYADADADVLKISHHGSRTSSTAEFIDAVSPKLAVISCGENNTYAHPHPETLDALSECVIMRTDISGDITVRARKNGKFKVL